MGFLYSKDGMLMKDGTPFLLRGFGLGGWFLPEGYMWKFYTKCDRPRRIEALIEELCGEEYTRIFWQEYLNRYITKQDMERISKNGFNSVRLPMNARHLIKREGECYVLEEEMIQRIDQLIEWCRENNLYVILDMHGAPGGQTGQNIDDSEKDLPELFINQEYEEQLIWLWKELATRYAKEEIIAGYDLLNEPLMHLFTEHNSKLLPLYRKLIKEIREVDSKHLVILEGVLWSTDFLVFEEFTKEEAQDGIMLQFHHYWNNPDKETIDHFKKFADKLSVPLFMGEGGENNEDWYTTFFPMLERENISWNFWSYKKMACDNSPMSFDLPDGWQMILDYLDGGQKPDRRTAQRIFDNFLKQVINAFVNENVWNALSRKVPLAIPAEAFDSCKGEGRESDSALFRISEPLSISFKHNHQCRKPDYKRYGGEGQPDNEKLVVWLREGEEVSYYFQIDKLSLESKIVVEGQGQLQFQIGDDKIVCNVQENNEICCNWNFDANGSKMLNIKCLSGKVSLDKLYLN